MASLAERPSGAPHSSTAPTLSTDRLTSSTTTAPPTASTAATSPYPDEDYRGWASL